MTGNGAHPPYMTVPVSTLVPLPDELSFEEGAAVSCGTGTAYGALKRLDVSGRDTLAAFGPGPGGLARHCPRATGSCQGIRRRRGDQPPGDRPRVRPAAADTW